MHAYNRVNHFRETMNQVQGKNNTDIPKDVIHIVSVNLVHDPSADPHNSEVYAAVRKMLKSQGMGKYVSNVPKIVTMATGKSPPHWSAHDIDRLVHGFNHVQSLLERDRPRDRTTFPYRFLLEKVSHLAQVSPKYHCDELSSTKRILFEQAWTCFMLKHFAKL